MTNFLLGNANESLMLLYYHKALITYSETPLIVWSPPEHKSGWKRPKIPCAFANVFRVKDFPTFLSLEYSNPTRFSSRRYINTIFRIRLFVWRINVDLIWYFSYEVSRNNSTYIYIYIIYINISPVLSFELFALLLFWAFFIISFKTNAVAIWKDTIFTPKLVDKCM